MAKKKKQAKKTRKKVKTKRVKKTLKKKTKKTSQKKTTKKKVTAKTVNGKPIIARAGITRKEETYTAKDITVLKGLEPVRRRPGMYIGGTGIDGLHHLIWEVVDNSLTYGTPVLIEQDGQVVLKKIGEIIDSAIESNRSAVISGKTTEILRSGFNIKSLSFDPQSLKLSWKPISSLIRHKVNSEIFEITLQNNRRIQITPYHSLFTLEHGEVKPILGSNLKIGSYVIVPKKFIEPKKYVSKINLFEELLKLSENKTASIYLYNVKNLLTDDLKPIVKKYVNLPRWSNVFYDFKRYNYLPFNIWRLFPKPIRKKFSRHCFLGNKRNDKFRLKPIINVNKNLVELLGIYAAEGTNLASKNTNRVVFSFGSQEKHLIKYVADLIEKIFGYKTKPNKAHQTAQVLQIDSLLISLIFKEIFRTGCNAYHKTIPSIIFNVSPELRERYLIAYLAGDGYPSKEFTHHLINNTAPGSNSRTKFTASSVSNDLLDNLSYLLFSLGKTFSINKNKIDFYWNTNSSYLDHLPVSEVISKISWTRPYSFSLNIHGGITSSKIATLIKSDRLMLYPGASRFLDSDLGVLKVVKIRKIRYQHKWVYDFSVPKGENFVAGQAPIIAHNSIDEAIAGYCKNIKVVLCPKNRVSVEDDGRGIPVEKHPITKKSALETVMCTLHAGAKFGTGGYKVAGGLHGVGVSVVNALSSWMRAEVKRDGKIFSQEYSRGKAITKLKKEGKTKLSGTKIIFEPDPEIFSKIEFDWKKILTHLRQQAYLTKGVKITIVDEREINGLPKELAPSYSFYFEGGIVSYINYLNRGEKLIHETPFYVERMVGDILVEAAFQYTDEIKGFEISFANNIHTVEGGTHLIGFRAALTRAINEYARKNDYLKEKEGNLSGDDVREGLTSVVSVKLKNPQFEGQTKAKLGNAEVRTVVSSVIFEAVLDFLEKHPQEARQIIGKVMLAAKARLAAKAAKDTVIRKGTMEGLTLPGKLADCSSRDPKECELYIVEGDSAGGSCKQGRDRRFQAILPLRGKILNVERARIDKILSSKEIKSLIIALGVGVGEEKDISKLRYDRIIIMTDADVDGAHIRTLLLTFFYRYFPELIETGHVYIAQPPLYRIQADKQVQYAYLEEDKNEIIDELKKKKKGVKISIQRYKGLGEMNPSQLWETTMKPENRVMLKVSIEDAEKADQIFDVLMGNEVEPRKRFIQTYAKSVKNLDI